jgi:hypothetical protein
MQQSATGPNRHSKSIQSSKSSVSEKNDRPQCRVCCRSELRGHIRFALAILHSAQVLGFVHILKEKCEKEHGQSRTQEGEVMESLSTSNASSLVKELKWKEQD